MHDIDLPTFINTLFPEYPAGEVPCLAKPGLRGWQQVPPSDRVLASIEAAPDEWYICVSTVENNGDRLRRRKEDCTAAWVLMLDDIGTKAERPDIEFSAMLETSEGNYTGLLFLEPVDLTDDDRRAYFEACNRAICQAGYGDEGAQGVNRVFRIPGSINKKEGRNNWVTRVTEWNPDAVWSLEEIMETLRLEPEYRGSRHVSREYEPTPGDYADPVMSWIGANGQFLGRATDDGWHDIVCPWADSHTDGGESAGYCPAGQGDYPEIRGFQCFHEHCKDRNIDDYLSWVKAQGGPDVGLVATREFKLDRIKKLIGAAEEEDRVPFDDMPPEEREATLYGLLPELRKEDLPLVTWKAPNKDGEIFPAAAQKATRPNLRFIVDSLGIVCRFDVMNKRPVLEFSDPHLQILAQNKVVFEDEKHGLYRKENDNVRRAIIDVALQLGIDKPAVIDELIAEMCHMNPFHPMAEWINSAEWDGTPRFETLVASVQVRDDSAEAWPLFLRRWLVQGVQAAFGYEKPRQMSAVLVFAGPQRKNKTTWFKDLVPRTFSRTGVKLDARSASGEKDAVMKATTRVIVELGELDSTFRQADIDTIKGFLAETMDAYREPYGREVRDWPRCTSFCATVNGLEFLNDPTGSSRFWPVEIIQCDSTHNGIDMQQLWAEAKTWWAAGERWWLDEREERLRMEVSEQFQNYSIVLEKAGFYLDRHTDKKVEYMNLHTFMERCLDIRPAERADPRDKKALHAFLNERLGKRREKVVIEGGSTIKRCWAVPVHSKMAEKMENASTTQGVTSLKEWQGGSRKNPKKQ